MDRMLLHILPAIAGYLAMFLVPFFVEGAQLDPEPILRPSRMA